MRLSSAVFVFQCPARETGPQKRQNSREFRKRHTCDHNCGIVVYSRKAVLKRASVFLLGRGSFKGGAGNIEKESREH